ncbi:tail fiber protein [Pelagibacter phage HTVC011P]|uniref:Tail fiber n=1 Tax=Pelagibacter phage HTVC011P TaxID=1283078 RepID=M1I882_9CAUD|nr:tail fiber protein [Pelagibacter phage HTVC011P]AGE60567.1 tail fiber [Pelagibacter phage HTVC011P]
MTQYAFNTYTGNGSTTQYSISFSYIDSTHVKCFLDGVETSAFTISSSTVTFNTAPTNSSVIRIERQTPVDSRLVDFQDGSVLTEAELDMSANQNFYAVQEITDDQSNNLGLTTADVYDANNKRIINVADPVDNTDAVNKQFISTNLPNITTVAGISADVTTVAGISADVTAVANDATDIGVVSTNIASVNTVATNIADVIKVADDLNEAISEVETVANDLNEATSEIEVVANNIVNVNTVGTINADVTTVANNETDIQTLADLEDGTVTTNGLSTLAGLNTEIQGVYNIRTNVTNVDTNATNVNLVAGQISPTNNVSAVSAVATEIGTLGALGTEITNLNNIRTDISGVNTISAEVTAVNNNSTNINTVAGLDTEITALGASGTVASINTVASNLASVNNFGEVYRISATAPTTSLDDGDMWFDTTADKLKIWNGSSFDLAGSSINGTSARFKYVATAGQTTFTGADANGETLAYDTGYIDAYLNGVHLDPSDYTATDGSNFVLSSGATVSDELYIVAFGTFSVANIDASNISAGTINEARLPTITNAKLDNSSITINGSAVNLGGSVTVGETKPTISSISPDTITNAQTSITITGSNFVSVPQVEFLNPSTGIWYVADTVTYNNSTSLTVNATLGVDGTIQNKNREPRWFSNIIWNNTYSFRCTNMEDCCWRY